jgi:RPA family protein
METPLDAPSQSSQPQQIQPRLVAVKAQISDLIAGAYFEVAGKWEPDYLITPAGERVSRVNLIGLVVANFFSEDGNYGTVTVDDGTETIRLKSFKGDVKALKELQIGQVVCVIGKVRKYKDEVYIAPETIVPSDSDREMLRKLELLRNKKRLSSLKELVLKTSPEFDDPAKLIEFLSTKYGFSKESIEAVLISQTSSPAAAPAAPIDDSAEPQSEGPKASPKAKATVLAAIESGGSAGVDYGAILKVSGLSAIDVDGAIKELIGEGEIFEPRSGRFRRLL